MERRRQERWSVPSQSRRGIPRDIPIGQTFIVPRRRRLRHGDGIAVVEPEEISRYDVAISFLARDESTAKALAEQLEASGLNVFCYSAWGLTLDRRPSRPLVHKQQRIVSTNYLAARLGQYSGPKHTCCFEIEISRACIVCYWRKAAVHTQTASRDCLSVWNRSAGARRARGRLRRHRHQPALHVEDGARLGAGATPVRGSVTLTPIPFISNARAAGRGMPAARQTPRFSSSCSSPSVRRHRR